MLNNLFNFSFFFRFKRVLQLKAKKNNNNTKNYVFRNLHWIVTQYAIFCVFISLFFCYVLYNSFTSAYC